MNKTPMKKAALYASGSIAITLLAGIALVLVALYVPYDRLLHYKSNDDSALETFLPPTTDMPAEMLLVRKIVSTNEDVARNYDNAEEMQRRLEEEFERVEGFSQRYVSKDRCRLLGPRSLMFSIVEHKSGAGAMRYLAFVKEKDIHQDAKVENYDLGQSGYTAFRLLESYCSNAKTETYAEITWTQENYLITVSMTAAADHNSHEEMIAFLASMTKAIE